MITIVRDRRVRKLGAAASGESRKLGMGMHIPWAYGAAVSPT
jgi:hypothetical protein